MAYSISEEQAFSCCASRQFAARLASGGPYAEFADLIAAARRIWWNEVGVTEWLAAFAAHPKIGDKKGTEDKPAAFAAFSRSEQAAAASSTTEDVAQQLSQLNQAYAEKFGHIFIIFAKGRSAPEILEVLKQRINRRPVDELQTASQEQMKITELRLGNVFGKSAEMEMVERMQKRAEKLLQQVTAAHASGPLRSPITTHVLDTAMGSPAQNLAITLLKQDPHSGQWEELGKGLTNADGRVPNLLPPGNFIPAGWYRMYFKTDEYLEACRQQHPAYYAAVPFYPEVTVDFQITDDKSFEHYHIPLLLSPYGYSTYRGS